MNATENTYAASTPSSFSIPVAKLADFWGISLDGSFSAGYFTEDSATDLWVEIYRDEEGKWHAASPLTDDWAPTSNEEAAALLAFSESN